MLILLTFLIYHKYIVDPFAEKSSVEQKKNTQQVEFGEDTGFTPLKNRANNNINSKRAEDPFGKSDPFTVSGKQIKNNFQTNFKANDANNNNNRFEVNFEDEFAKSSNNFLKKENDQFNNNFAKFDAFNENRNEIDNFTKNLNFEKKPQNIEPEKLTKFNEDYSDNFEIDLQNVLHRSLEDK